MSSTISSIRNSSSLSLRQDSSSVVSENQTWRSKSVRVCNLGRKSTFRGSLSIPSASFSKRISIRERLAFSGDQSFSASRRQRSQICLSSDRATGTAVEEAVLDEAMDQFVEVVHKLADTAREITLKYFRSKFQIIDKADLSKFHDQSCCNPKISSTSC